jgi:hypothetical protein
MRAVRASVLLLNCQKVCGMSQTSTPLISEYHESRHFSARKIRASPYRAEKHPSHFGQRLILGINGLGGVGSTALLSINW